MKDISLLPDGLSDILPPQAGFQREIQNRLMALFQQNGYVELKPPLVEFAESLNHFNGAATDNRRDSFRTTDPISQHTLAFRTDMTAQVARVAMAGLRDEPRPLRLCYAGDVVRIKGSLLRPDRQFTQTGCELIGNDSIYAEAELLSLAVEALTSIGIEGISVDIALVNMHQLLAQWFGFDGRKTALLFEAFRQRKLDAVAELSDDKNQLEILYAVLKQSGSVPEMAEFFSRFQFPPPIAHYFDKLKDLWGLLAKKKLPAEFHIDCAETRGFAYHHGWAYTFYCQNAPQALGRGGTYHLPVSHEHAVGFSFYMDSIISLSPPPARPEKILLPLEVSTKDKRKLQKQGYRIVPALEPLDGDDLALEARRTGCQYYHQHGQLIAVRT